MGDALWDEILYPFVHRLLAHCGAVLRPEGASGGTDDDVRVAG